MADLVYQNFPSTQFEAELNYPLLFKRKSPSDQVLFLLEQELLYAQNLFGAGNFVNTHAVLGQLPFTRGDVYTTIDFQIKNTDVVPFSIINSILKGGETSLGTYEDVNKSQTTSEINTGYKLTTPADLGKKQLEGIVKNAINSIKKTINSPNIPNPLDIVKGKKSNNKNVNNYIPDLIEEEEIIDNKITSNENSHEEFIKKQHFPFYFKSLNYQNSSDKKYIFFKAIINGLSESFNPVWSQLDVFGRPHPLWIYSNVSRIINLEILIITLNPENLVFVRDRAEWLAKHTYPTLDTTSSKLTNFKSGPLVSLTLGDLYKNLNGFISNLDFDWNYLKRWNVSKSGDRVASGADPNFFFEEKFPQGVRVSMRFNVLEEKIIHNTDNDKVNIYNPFNLGANISTNSNPNVITDNTLA